MNRRKERPLQLYLTGLRDAGAMTKNLFGLENWDVFRTNENHVTYFGKEKVGAYTRDIHIFLLE